MLVVSRRKDDVIYLDLSAIDPDIEPIRVVLCEVVISEGFSPKVRIGIDADRRITIHRDEIKLKHSQREPHEPQEMKGR